MSSAPYFDMVVFGGSGDLAMRKLLPALYYCHKNRQLPEGRIIGVSRGDLTRDGYLEGRLGDGSGRVHVETGSGSIRVRGS